MKYKNSSNLKSQKKFLVLIGSVLAVLALFLLIHPTEDKSIPVQNSTVASKNELETSESDSNLDLSEVDNRESDLIASEEDKILISTYSLSSLELNLYAYLSSLDASSSPSEAFVPENDRYYEFVQSVFRIYDNGQYLCLKDKDSDIHFYMDPNCEEEINNYNVKIISSNPIQGNIISSSGTYIPVMCYLLANWKIAYIPADVNPDFILMSETDSNSSSSEVSNQEEYSYDQFVECVFSVYDDLYLTDQNDNHFYSNRDCSEELSGNDVKIICSTPVPGLDSKGNSESCYLLQNRDIAFIPSYANVNLFATFDGNFE